MTGGRGATGELVVTRAELSLDGPALGVLASRLSDGAAGPVAWHRGADGSPFPQRILAGEALALCFVERAPGRHVLHRVESGLGLGAAALRAVAGEVSRAGGVLDGVWRGADGEDLDRVRVRPAPAEAGAVGWLVPDLADLPPLRPRPLPPLTTEGDLLARRAADRSTPAEILGPLVAHRRLRPFLAENPALTRSIAEDLLTALLKDGPWEAVHALAVHPVWAGELPSALRRAPFAGEAARVAWYDAAARAPAEEGAALLERLLLWGCEVDRDSLNLAPWLPLGVSARAVEALLLPEGPDPEDGEPDDAVACWSLPPLRPSAFQRLLAVRRWPEAPPLLRQTVDARLQGMRLSGRLRDALWG